MSGNECYLPEFDSNVDRSTTINDVDLEPMDRGRMRSDLLEIVKCVCVCGWREGSRSRATTIAWVHHRGKGNTRAARSDREMRGNCVDSDQVKPDQKRQPRSGRYIRGRPVPSQTGTCQIMNRTKRTIAIKRSRERTANVSAARSSSCP